jgi:hypothetical protein
VALSWPAEETSELMEQFIGIVRGRTVNSSRGPQPAKAKPAAKRAATPARGRGKPRRRG